VRRVDKPRELTRGKGKDAFRSELEARASRTRAKTLRALEMFTERETGSGGAKSRSRREREGEKEAGA
jgi:hypothetical protein